MVRQMCAGLSLRGPVSLGPLRVVRQGRSQLGTQYRTPRWLCASQKGADALSPLGRGPRCDRPLSTLASAGRGVAHGGVWEAEGCAAEGEAGGWAPRVRVPCGPHVHLLPVDAPPLLSADPCCLFVSCPRPSSRVADYPLALLSVPGFDLMAAFGLVEKEYASIRGVAMEPSALGRSKTFTLFKDAQLTRRARWEGRGWTVAREGAAVQWGWVLGRPHRSVPQSRPGGPPRRAGFSRGINLAWVERGHVWVRVHVAQAPIRLADLRTEAPAVSRVGSDQANLQIPGLPQRLLCDHI